MIYIYIYIYIYIHTHTHARTRARARVWGIFNKLLYFIFQTFFIYLVAITYTVQSISFSTVFFLNNRTRAIYRPTHWLSTINQHPFTHQVLFVYLRQLRVITRLVKSVFFIRHGWRKWTESCHKILFQSWSVCNRNTSISAKGLWEWGCEPIKCF